MSNTNPWPSSGSVGIGTTSPGTPLEVEILSDSTGILRLTRYGVAAWDFGVRNTPALTGLQSGSLEIIPQNGNTDFAIGKSDGVTAILTAKNSGNVGIGTTSPAALLHVAGAVQIDGGQTVKVTTITGNTTLDATYFAVLVDTAPSGSAITVNVTLPSASANSGRQYQIKNKNIGTVQVFGTGSDMIDGKKDATYGALKLKLNEAATLVSDGANWFVF